VRQRVLGRSGIAVAELALGCAGFWGSRAFPEAQAAAIVEQAVDAGINLFDTGRNYSGYHAEPRLGRILRPLIARHGRERFVISTKAGTLVPAGSLWPARWRRRQKDFSPDAIERSCLDSLRALDCGHLDIFQLHDAAPGDLEPALLTRLQRLREQGLVRHLGIYTHDDAQIDAVLRMPEVFDVVLLDYNALLGTREPRIAALHAAGIGVLAGTVLAQGHLVEGRIGRLRRPADAWYLARALLQPAARRLARTARPVRELLATQHGLAPAQAALAWVLENPAIAACVAGTTATAHLKALVQACGARLEPELRAAIERATACCRCG
jgi:aryl-alcohol dehydrogenase-like predicted oxidoreductase